MSGKRARYALKRLKDGNTAYPVEAAALIEKYLAALEAKIAALEAKVEDLRNACREQHRALCQICYAMEEPNEMNVSTQDVFPDSERVKSAVRELRDKFAALKEAQGGGLPHMLLEQANRRRDELNAALRKIERLEGEKIPMVKRPTGRTIPDLTKREHVCEYQGSIRPTEKGGEVLAEGWIQESPGMLGTQIFSSEESLWEELAMWDSDMHEPLRPGEWLEYAKKKEAQGYRAIQVRIVKVEERRA